jgi:hypothetical protein
MRKNKWLSHYVWVAQLQTGKRAKEKGKYSYRAENGSAIHFHIISMTERGSDLQIKNAQKVLRSIWKTIVNDWEIRSGFPVQNIGGVDITAVYDASRYVSRYIANEQDTIQGNMWGMSSDMRKLIQPDEKYISVPDKVFKDVCFRVDARKMYRYNAEGRSERLKIASGNTIAVKNWNSTYVLLTNDFNMVFSDFQRYSRNYGFDINIWTQEDKQREQWRAETVKTAKSNMFRKYPDKSSVLRNASLHFIEQNNSQLMVLKPVPKPVPKPVQLTMRVPVF